MTPVERQHQRFSEAMRNIGVGARLRRCGGDRIWTVLSVRYRETSADIVIGCGYRTHAIHVPICMSGPCLLDVGMESVHT